VPSFGEIVRKARSCKKVDTSVLTATNLQDFGTFGNQRNKNEVLGSKNYQSDGPIRNLIDELVNSKDISNKNQLRDAINKQHSKNVKTMQDKYIDTMDDNLDHHTQNSDHQTAIEKENLIALRKTIDDRLSELDEISRGGSVIGGTQMTIGHTSYNNSKIGSRNLNNFNQLNINSVNNNN
jgi:hypothetical protein